MADCTLLGHLVRDVEEYDDSIGQASRNHVLRREELVEDRIVRHVLSLVADEFIVVLPVIVSHSGLLWPIDTKLDIDTTMHAVFLTLLRAWQSCQQQLGISWPILSSHAPIWLL